MKTLRITRNIIFTLLVFNFFCITQAQDYTLSIENGTQLTSNKFQFEIKIKSNADDFVLEAYQTALNFNEKIISEGEINFEYVPESSELKNVPTFGIGIFASDGQKELTFASNPAGNDTINGVSKRIGKFVITNSKPFAEFKPEIKWNFAGIINTIFIKQVAVDITQSATSIDLNFDNNLTAVNEEDNSLPKNFELYQNYPNPFNPATKISYSLATESEINIKIFNLIGERVFEINNEAQSAGVHKFEWNANNLASGIYILAMNADPINGTEKFTSIKKMTLMK